MNPTCRSEYLLVAPRHAVCVFYIRMCVCVYVCVYVSMHVWMCTCICARMHVCMYACMNVCMCVCICVECMHVCVSRMHVIMSAYIHWRLSVSALSRFSNTHPSSHHPHIHDNKNLSAWLHACIRMHPAHCGGVGKEFLHREDGMNAVIPAQSWENSSKNR